MEGPTETPPAMAAPAIPLGCEIWNARFCESIANCICIVRNAAQPIETDEESLCSLVCIVCFGYDISLSIIYSIG